MNITLTNTAITQDVKTLAFEKNNGVDVINITVDTDENWQYKIDVKYPDKCCTGESLYNIIDLTRNGNVCSVTLTQDMLPFNGKYTMQLRGINGDKIYHSETFDCWVKYSIDPAQAYEPVPSEFYQLEKELFEKADSIVSDAVEKTAETYPLLEALEADGDTNKSVKTVASNNTIDGNISGSAIFGSGNELTGDYHDWNIVGGYQNQVEANNTLTTGARNITKGHNSTQNGQDNEARLNNGYNIGNKNVTTAENAQNLGSALLATGEQQTVVGTTNAPDDDAVFIVGNGTDARSNAVTIKKDGSVTIGGRLEKQAGKMYADVMRIVAQDYRNVTSLNGNTSGKILSTDVVYASGEKSVALYCNQETLNNIATTVLRKTDTDDLNLSEGTALCIQFRVYCAEEKDITFVIGAVGNNTNFYSSWRELNVVEKTVTIPANAWTTVCLVANNFEHTTGYVTLGATFDGAKSNPTNVYIARVVVDTPANWLSRYGTGIAAVSTPDRLVFSSANYGTVSVLGNGEGLHIDPKNNSGAIRPQFFITNDDGNAIKVTKNEKYRLSFSCSSISVNNEMQFWITNDANTTTNFPYTQTSQKNANVVYESEKNTNGQYNVEFTAIRDGYVRVGFTTYSKLESFIIAYLCLYKEVDVFPPIFEYSSDKVNDTGIRYKVGEIQTFGDPVIWMEQQQLVYTPMTDSLSFSAIGNNIHNREYTAYNAIADVISEISPDMSISERGVYLSATFENNNLLQYSYYNITYDKWVAPQNKQGVLAAKINRMIGHSYFVIKNRFAVNVGDYVCIRGNLNYDNLLVTKYDVYIDTSTLTSEGHLYCTIPADFSLRSDGKNYIWVAAQDNIATFPLGEQIMTLGTNNIAQGSYTVIEGTENKAVNKYAHIEGRANLGGYGAHVEGIQNTISGTFSHGEGINNTVEANYAHAEGGNNSVKTDYKYDTTDEIKDQQYLTGWFSHAEGLETQTQGTASHASGYKTYANGFASHTEGINNIANGKGSHAEGAGTTASGTFAHAEGSGTTASGNGSHAMGVESQALGTGSLVNGFNSLSRGDYSFATGKWVSANGESSFSAGISNGSHGLATSTIGSNLSASSKVEGQNVVGRYNAQNDNAVFIVGNGISDTAQKNAFSVNTDNSISIGDTKLTEAQLKQLLALLNTNSTGKEGTTDDTFDASET